MLHLWKAEWIKTRRRPTNIALLITTICVVSISIAVLAIVALVKGEGSADYQSTVQALPFPNALNFPLVFITNLGTLLAVIFVANNIGSEFTRDTWKMVLPRNGSRLRFMFTKILMAVMFMAMIIVVALVVGQGVAWIAGLAMGAEFVTDTSGLSDILKGLTIDFLGINFYIAFTLFAVTLFRSAIGGIIAGIFLPIIFQISSFVWQTLAYVIPENHIQNIRNEWIGGGMFGMPENLFPEPVSLTVSLVIVFTYIIVLIGGAMAIFRRRDMAG